MFVLAVALCAGAAPAQNSAAAPVAQPSSPAPAVSPTATGSDRSAPVVVPSSSAVATPTSATQIVYAPKLPTAAELTNAASAQGYTVERIVQTATQVIAFYRNASGQPVTVAYQSLPPSGTVPTPTAAPAPVVVTSPPPTIVYETAPRVIYYDYPVYPAYYPYYPRVWYPPVSFSFGFGYHSFHGGGYRGHHGGFHGHR
jgi:hypothetical protein